MFFALWPSRAEAAALSRFAQQLPLGTARRMRPDTLHLNLAFIGDVDAAALDALRTAGLSVSGEGFRVTLDTCGWWPHNRILWAGCRQVPAALGSLAAGLGAALGAHGFRTESRPFKAHVTLARRVRAPEPLPVLQSTWTCCEFVLAASTLSPDGAQYRILDRFPLREVDPLSNAEDLP